MVADYEMEVVYEERNGERVLRYSLGDKTAVLAQNLHGYAMIAVRTAVDGDEIERYYGFEMALDHAAELLGVHPRELPVPEVAADMGM